jgi:hypothetical protein
MKYLIIFLLLGSICYSQSNTRIVGYDSDGNRSALRMRSNGSIDVNSLDPTMTPVIVNFNKIVTSTTLTDTVAIDDYTIVVDDTTGVFANRYLTIFNVTLNRFYVGNVLSINVDTLTLDTPLDAAYPAGSFVDITTDEMAVDGSGASQTYGVRGVSPSPIGLSVDIVRIIFTCVTDSPVDLTKFGDITGGLTKGLVLRKRDGTYDNIFNVKTNRDLAGTMFDWEPYLASNPQQGVDGFVSRLTFGSMGKMGVVIRLMAGEDLELLVQDDLSDLATFKITAEGHFSEEQ